MGRRVAFPERMENKRIFSSGIQLRVSRRTISKPFPVHCHEFFELEFILSGEGVHILNGQEMKIGRNSFFLLTPADFHSMVPVSGSIEYYNLMFSRAWLAEELADGLYASRRPFAGRFEGERAEQYVHSMEKLMHEYDMDGLCHGMMLHHLVDIVLCDALRTFEKTEAALTPCGSEIQKALQYIENHFRSPLTLRSIAASVHLSPSYFSARFGETVGRTFSAYLQELRLEYACNLLKASRMTVNEVCHHSGFRSEAHFDRAFKNRFGCTPRQMRGDGAQHRK